MCSEVGIKFLIGNSESLEASLYKQLLFINK